MDRKVGRWGAPRVDRKADRSEGPRVGRKVGRWGAPRVGRKADRKADRSEGPRVGRWGDRMVGRSEEPRAETVGASEGPVVALDSFRVRVRIQPMVQAC